MEADLKGRTPLDEDEADGLIADGISTSEELNASEQLNVLEGERWALKTRNPDICSASFFQELHRRMFGDVWKWAGSFRKSDKSIGTHWREIPVAILNLCSDLGDWMEKGTYPHDEIGARFHHRLVAIHPFPNGNGRHARLITDLLMIRSGQPRFTWGAADLTKAGSARQRYIRALRAADKFDYALLKEFVRS